jgi:hypothetical protein
MELEANLLEGLIEDKAVAKQFGHCMRTMKNWEGHLRLRAIKIGRRTYYDIGELRRAIRGEPAEPRRRGRPAKTA